jgi:ABC-type nickel/cobalt efflux system permease component RcnA
VCVCVRPTRTKKDFDAIHSLELLKAPSSLSLSSLFDIDTGGDHHHHAGCEHDHDDEPERGLESSLLESVDIPKVRTDDDSDGGL